MRLFPFYLIIFVLCAASAAASTRCSAASYAYYEGEEVMGNYKNCYYNYQGETIIHAVGITTRCPRRIEIS